MIMSVRLGLQEFRRDFDTTTLGHDRQPFLGHFGSIFQVEGNRNVLNICFFFFYNLWFCCIRIS